MAEPFDINFVNKVIRETEKLTMDRMFQIALNFHSIVSYWTPVDRGPARAGWTFTLNEPREYIPDRPPPGMVLPLPRSEPDRRATKYGDSYHIANFVPYIVYLNEGSSEKAPAKFVETAMQYAVNIVNRNT